MKNVIISFCVCLLVLFCSCKLNKKDKHDRKQGRWKVYYDDEKKNLLYKGHYKDHRQVGMFKYYLPDGSIYLKEKYLPGGWVKTVYYHPNGEKQAEGYAQLIFDKDTTFYRWEGNWKKYDSTGTLKETAFYKCGKFAWYIK